jgi:hypothetical protein
MILFCLQISYTDLQIQRRFCRYKDDFVLSANQLYRFADTKTILQIQRRFCSLSTNQFCNNCYRLFYRYKDDFVSEHYHQFYNNCYRFADTKTILFLNITMFWRAFLTHINIYILTCKYITIFGFFQKSMYTRFFVLS